MTEPDQNDFGAKLRAARERRGVSLCQIAASTKISVGALEALESNDLEHLPGGIFTRAFIRSFASEVGLDPEEAVRDFLAQSQAGRMLAGSVYVDDTEDHGQYLSQQRVARTALWIILLSVPIAALLLFLGWGGESEELASPAALVPDERSAEVDAGREGTATPPSPTVSEPPAAVQGIAVGPLTIEIHPRAQCWVSLTVDGEQVFARVMQSGEREAREAEREIVISVGDAGAFDYSINRQPGRALGRDGEVVTARIDRDNYRSFVRP